MWWLERLYRAGGEMGRVLKPEKLGSQEEKLAR